MYVRICALGLVHTSIIDFGGENDVTTERQKPGMAVIVSKLLVTCNIQWWMARMNFSKTSRPAPEAYQPPSQWRPEFFPGCKTAGA
jgi:hypothetical protein